MTALTEIVIASLMRATGGSGVQSHVRTLVDFLHGTSRSVTFVNPFSSRSPLLYPVFGVRLGIRPVSEPAGVWWYRHWHGRFLEKALARHLAGRSRSVVYVQCPVSAHAALRARTGQPVVMAAHFNMSQADEWAAKGAITPGGALFQSIRAFEERVLAQLDGIVYVSAFSRALMEERIPRLRTVPSVVIPNPVAVATPRPAPGRMGDLVTVGALEPHKNQAYLLRILEAAARRGHRYTLTVIGDGPDRRALEELARELGVSGQVRFVGYQPDPRPLLRGHRLCCHASTMESFGIALAEAMAEGLPVLAAAVGGVPEVVRAGRDGMFWPLDDAPAAANVLIELMEDEPGRARMADAARTRVTEEFSADVVGRRLLAFLDTFTAQHPSADPCGSVR